MLIEQRERMSDSAQQKHSVKENAMKSMDEIAMLTIRRSPGEAIVIGDSRKITFVVPRHFPEPTPISTSLFDIRFVLNPQIKRDPLKNSSISSIFFVAIALQPATP